MLEEFLLDPKEELKLHLVKHEQISASIITLSMNKNHLRIYEIEKNTMIPNDRLSALFDKKVMKEEYIEKFREFLKRNKIHYFENTPIILYNLNSKNNLLCKNISFTISSNPNLLQAIANNMQPEQFLHLTGWPKDDAKEFIYNKHEINKDKNYILMNFALAKKENKLPEWGAYLLFIPMQFDLINDNVKIKTITECTRIRKYIHRSNPGLAMRLEREYYETNYPDKWELIQNQYIPHYNISEIEKKLQIELAQKLN